MPDTTPPPAPAAAPAPATPAPAAKQAASAKAPKTTKMSPEQKLDAILTYMEKQDRRERRRALGGAFRQLLSLVYLGAFLYAGWYMYANQDALMESLLKKSTDYALEAAGRQNGTGGTMQLQLDENFLQQLTDRITQQAVDRQQNAQSSAPVLPAPVTQPPAASSQPQPQFAP